MPIPGGIPAGTYSLTMAVPYLVGVSLLSLQRVKAERQASGETGINYYNSSITISS